MKAFHFFPSYSFKIQAKISRFKYKKNGIIMIFVYVSYVVSNFDFTCQKEEREKMTNE